MPKGIRSLTGFINKIENLRKKMEGDLSFRGHSDIAFTLQPSVFRDTRYREHERDLIYRLIAESPHVFDNDRYFFDRLVRAQHFGVPTRLLDVTTNPLMALYFACEINDNQRAQVIVFETPKNSSKFFLSDAISCKSNLTHLNLSEREQMIELIARKSGTFLRRVGGSTLTTVRREKPEVYAEHIKELNDETIFMRLVQFIREEKPYFQNIIDPLDLLTVEMSIPKMNNARIAAQAGAFLVFGLLEEFGGNASRHINVVRIDIPGEVKCEIRTGLQAIGIHENSVYPEFDESPLA